MDRQETWEGILDALEQHFQRGQYGDGEFDVHHNNGVGSISIIHRPTSSVLTLTDTTGARYDSENRIVFEEAT